MENDPLRSRITQTFRDVFGDSNLVISDSMTAEDVEEWDSLSHINLIVALEREFRVKFTTGEVSKLKNVGDLVSLIQRKTS
jgi:acyl carrier protein